MSNSETQMPSTKDELENNRLDKLNIEMQILRHKAKLENNRLDKLDIEKQLFQYNFQLENNRLEKLSIEKRILESSPEENILNKLISYKLLPDSPKLHITNIITYLRLFNGYIAGSSALFSYIKSNEKEGDLDIWFQVSIDPNDKSLPYSKDVRNVLSDYMQTIGYNSVTYSDYFQNGTKQEYLENTRFNNLIEKIYEYCMGSKKIQIILTKVPKIEILKSFDLSFCAVSWDGSKYEALEPELTAKKIGYSLNLPTNKKEISRLKKYTTKGFKIYESKDLVL